MNISTARILTLFFAACFLSMQLCQVYDVEPVKQNTDTFYAVESGGIVWPSSGIQSLIYPKQYAKIKPKLVSQKALLSQQQQYQRLIEHQVQRPFVYPKLQSLDVYLYAVKQSVSFIAQQQSQLFIQPPQKTSYRVFKPDFDQDPSYFSLS